MVDLRMHEFGDLLNPSILFLHGAGSDHTMWQPQIDQLAPYFRLFVPDLRGAGESAGPFVLDQVAATIAAHIRESGVVQVHVCGLSLGAMVAVRLAATEPALVRSVMLSGVQLKPSKLLMMVQRGIMSMTPWRLLGADNPAEKRRVMGLIRAIQDVDLREQSTCIQVPTLVVCGSKDRVNLHSSQRAADAIPDAAYKVIQNAGHQWNTQLPDTFNSTLRAFIEAHA